MTQVFTTEWNKHIPVFWLEAGQLFLWQHKEYVVKEIKHNPFELTTECGEVWKNWTLTVSIKTKTMNHLRQCTCFGDEIDYECPVHKIMYGLKESPPALVDLDSEQNRTNDISPVPSAIFQEEDGN